MTAPVAIRPFRAGDLDALARVLRGALQLPGLTPEWIARDFLLAEGFSADQLLVAVDDATPVGCVLTAPDAALAAGWIVGFGVSPEYHRRGIASALIAAAIGALRDHGARRIDVADAPARYLLPGIDRQAFPAAHALLTGRFGFAPRDEVASMGLRLTGAAAVDPDPSDDIRPCAPGEYPLLRAFLRQEFDPGWWAFFQRSIMARLSGDPTPSQALCCWRDGRIIGAAHFRGDRFGPLAVAAGARGRGIGARLTRATLAAMRASGRAEAYFLIASAEVEPFYARLGFHPLRRFTRLTRAL